MYFAQEKDINLGQTAMECNELNVCLPKVHMLKS